MADPGEERQGLHTLLRLPAGAAQLKQRRASVNKGVRSEKRRLKLSYSVHDGGSWEGSGQEGCSRHSEASGELKTGKQWPRHGPGMAHEGAQHRRPRHNTEGPGMAQAWPIKVHNTEGEGT